MRIENAEIRQFTRPGARLNELTTIFSILLVSALMAFKCFVIRGAKLVTKLRGEVAQAGACGLLR